MGAFEWIQLVLFASSYAIGAVCLFVLARKKTRDRHRNEMKARLMLILFGQVQVLAAFVPAGGSSFFSIPLKIPRTMWTHWIEVAFGFSIWICAWANFQRASKGSLGLMFAIFFSGILVSSLGGMVSVPIPGIELPIWWGVVNIVLMTFLRLRDRQTFAEYWARTLPFEIPYVVVSSVRRIAYAESIALLGATSACVSFLHVFVGLRFLQKFLWRGRKRCGRDGTVGGVPLLEILDYDLNDPQFEGACEPSEIDDDTADRGSKLGEAAVAALDRILAAPGAREMEKAMEALATDSPAPVRARRRANTMGYLGEIPSMFPVQNERADDFLMAAEDFSSGRIQTMGGADERTPKPKLRPKYRLIPLDADADGNASSAYKPQVASDDEFPSDSDVLEAHDPSPVYHGGADPNLMSVVLALTKTGRAHNFESGPLRDTPPSAAGVNWFFIRVIFPEAFPFVEATFKVPDAWTLDDVIAGAFFLIDRREDRPRNIPLTPRLYCLQSEIYGPLPMNKALLSVPGISTYDRVVLKSVVSASPFSEKTARVKVCLPRDLGGGEIYCNLSTTSTAMEALRIIISEKIANKNEIIASLGHEDLEYFEPDEDLGERLRSRPPKSAVELLREWKVKKDDLVHGKHAKRNAAAVYAAMDAFLRGDQDVVEKIETGRKSLADKGVVAGASSLGARPLIPQEAHRQARRYRLLSDNSGAIQGEESVAPLFAHAYDGPVILTVEKKDGSIRRSMSGFNWFR
jgi:hypothetical protein